MLLLSAPLLLPIYGSVSAAENPGIIAYAARIAGDELRTRIVVEFESEPDFAVHYLANPERLVVDLPATNFAFPPQALSARGLFSDIRYGNMGPDRSRIVLTARGPAAFESVEVANNGAGAGFRLILDAVATSDGEFADLMSDQIWTPEDSVAIDSKGPRRTGDEFVIVIDAGHGGIDDGAIGQLGAIEKNVTLAFAKELKLALGTNPRAQVQLTRSDDSFLSLAERVRVGRKHAADLFISIHADSIRYADLRGATVYTLSEKASDDFAASVAAQENYSDVLAGLALEEDRAEISDILMDLTRRETTAFSVSVARRIIDGFNGNVRLIKNPHRYAGFRVLRAPDVPSVLVELGYLSNIEDEKLLTNPEWRAATAKHLAAAIEQYRTTIMAGE